MHAGSVTPAVIRANQQFPISILRPTDSGKQRAGHYCLCSSGSSLSLRGAEYQLLHDVRPISGGRDAAIKLKYGDTFGARGTNANKR